jgi:hypothetical protein
MAARAKAKSDTKGKSDSKSKTTKDHDEIRRWAEERGGKPTMVEGTRILRFNFDEPGGDDDDKQKGVSWEEFFEVFDESDLSFLYTDETADGKTSRFFKFVRE